MCGLSHISPGITFNLLQSDEISSENSVAKSLFVANKNVIFWIAFPKLAKEYTERLIFLEHFGIVIQNEI